MTFVQVFVASLLADFVFLALGTLLQHWMDKDEP